MYELLDKVNSPADIRSFTLAQLKQLCSEIRDYMVRCCAENPGHLGSSLGAVELIVALHYIYNTPDDKLVFDVGHQAYAHKILTGRREEFRRIRTKGGISGFPRRSESPYDAFGAGHSSTSISAALGLAEAAAWTKSGEKVVALIGDGAMTGGLAFEGMNNAGAAKSNILIILNDNDQSIDKNIGAFHNYLLKITTDSTYNSLKNKIWNRIGESKFRDCIQKITTDAKSNLVRKSGGALFEALGFRYFGPIDGNDIQQLTNTLSRLSKLDGPRILHVHTLKGKGYAPAEADPTTWHAPGRFNPDNGERLRNDYTADRYQDVFGEVLVDLAKMDSRVVAITPAMATGCGMKVYAEKFPNRFFDVGIAEEHAVTFSAGLAAGGLRPICNIYSSFAQRAYDQIVHDVALQNLPVILCFDRAGLVGEDGATHNGCYDIASLRCIPNTVIAAPCNELELKNLMYSALHHKGGPYIIRYPRGCGEGKQWRGSEYKIIEDGCGEKLREGSEIAVLALGPAVGEALRAVDNWPESLGKAPAVYDMRFVKPVDTKILAEVAAEYEAVLTIEDGCVKGGLFGEVCEYMSTLAKPLPVRALGIPDEFIHWDSQPAQRSYCGIEKGEILKKIAEIKEKVLENKI